MFGVCGVLLAPLVLQPGRERDVSSAAKPAEPVVVQHTVVKPDDSVSIVTPSYPNPHAQLLAEGGKMLTKDEMANYKGIDSTAKPASANLATFAPLITIS